MSDYEDCIFTMLENIQEETKLIDKEVDIRDAYGMARSFRRGSVARAQNMEVSSSDVEWIARWNSGDGTKDGATPYFQGDMRVHYSDQKQMAKTFLRFSQAL